MRTHRIGIEQRIVPPNATALCDANRLGRSC
jgi:hypothetical protein